MTTHDPTSLHDAVRLAVLDGIKSPEVQAALAAASKVALRDELLKLGIDTNKPAQFYSDLNALRNWVSMWRTARGAIIKTAAGTLVAGLLALIWLGTQDWILKLVKVRT